ncbi:hypothetical protein [Paenisporosarcina sp. OV554]|uniref:hypothetical protein n=1 Tax=Paenisporosarcina sp. OV554 TaxID=2135694 RepID=UPI000D426F6C|nr:hypothetical protein [Paenisporosarcina sp. OV554]PUB08247.1 hypothetical protein C8K15_1389 [Paenisporosarcina sp. OV554]
MTKTILFLVSFITLLFSTVYATTSDKPSSYEEIYPEIGYKTVEAASDDFEKHFNEKLKLPLRVPPVSFTHHFGRFNDLDGDANDSFEVTLINDKISENHYKIDVRPLKNKLPIREKYVIKTFELKNGIVATYMTFSGFNFLVFERDNWQYTLNIDKRVSNKA